MGRGPGRYTPEKTGTLCIGGWVGSWAYLFGCGKSNVDKFGFQNIKGLALK